MQLDHYQRCAIKQMGNVYVKRDMLVLGVINAYIVIMGTQTVNHVVVRNVEVRHLFVMHQENVLVYLVLLGEHVNNVVQDTINILNANVNAFILYIIFDFNLNVYFSLRL